LFLELGFAAAAEHEEVAAEKKVVAELLHLDLGPSDCFAFGIPNGDGAVAFAVLFNARLGLREDLLIGRFGFPSCNAPGRLAEQQGGCAGASPKKCPSVHSHSKQQRAALLKLKILFGRAHPDTITGTPD
jgi:hypothetical protein